MSLSNGSAEHPAKPARSVRAHSPFAPDWARAGGAPPRKVVPLRLPSAPQLVPPPLPPAPAGADLSGASRVSGPDLLAQDEVLKRLLESAPPDPQPIAVQPVRDPVGLALGMVARLIVAASAVAGIAMLLFGIVPMPFRIAIPSALSAAPAASAPLATVAAAPMATSATPEPRSSDGDTNVPAKGDTTTTVAAPPARVATVAVRPPPPSGPDPATLAPDEVDRLVKRGQEYLAQGDIAAARLILGRATDGHDARAALVLAQTFDPRVLKQLHVLGVKPDLGQARAWYQKAADDGSPDAAQQLATLSNAGQ